MNEQDIFAMALQDFLTWEIAEYQKISDHRFSLRFNKKMKRLLYTPPVFELQGRRIPLKRAITAAMLVIILAALLTGATFAVYKLWENYRIEDNSLYSMLYIADIENSPETLEEEYRIGADMSGYDFEVILQHEYCNMVNYSKPNGDITISITFSQTTKEFSEQLFLNTENAIVQPTEIVINGYQGIYFETYNNIHAVIWSTDKYVFYISGYEISKNELISLAEAVQKVDS